MNKHGKFVKFDRVEDLVKFLNNNIHVCGQTCVKEVKQEGAVLQIYPKSPAHEGMVKKLLTDLSINKESACYEVPPTGVAAMLEKCFEYEGTMAELPDGIYFMSKETQKNDREIQIMEFLEEAIVDESMTKFYLLEALKLFEEMKPLVEEYE